MKKNYKLFAASLIAIAINSANAQCPIPSLVTASPGTICAGATTSLNATAVGTSINWYTVPVGGVPVGSSASGANFTISPAITTTYYAESYTSAVPTTTYAFTGAVQSYTVPAGVSSLTVEAYGAQGQNSGTSTGGLGAYTKATVTVTPGQVINIFVGGNTGFNGGGTAGTSSGTYLSGNGGGASDIRIGGVALTNRVLVAGGGGGAGRQSCTSQTGGAGGYPGGLGGWGDGVTGTNGGVNGGGSSGAGGCAVCCSSSRGGGGGGQNGGGGAGGYGTSTGGTAGGCGTTNTDPFGGGVGTNPTGGCLGIGGNGGFYSSNGAGGGGGGGWYGGGAGGGNWGSGGGGGSSYYGTLAAPTTSNGVRSGNGQIVISGSPTTCTSVSRTSVTVTVGSIPTISVTSGAVCAGSSYTMVASGAGTYSYTGGSAVVTPTATMSYSVTGTSTLGCAASNTAVSSVTVNALPTITVNSGTICAGKSFTISPTGASTYTYSGGSAVVSPTANTSYTVTGTNTLGCISSVGAVSSITVNASPVVTATSSNSLICSGEVALLTASTSAISYTWNTGATTMTTSVSPTVTTTYTVSSTGTNGCVGNGNVTVNVSACTGINEALASLISVYPNPTSGLVNVILTSELSKNSTLEVYDAIGKLVVKQVLANETNSINISNLNNGIYTFKVLNNSNLVKIGKIVKQ